MMRIATRLSFFLALALVLAAAGCQSAEGNDPHDQPDGGGGEWVPVQLNDVSVMFPLATAAELDGGYLAASATGARGALLPAAIYQNAGAITGSGTPPPGGFALAPYESLRVVAMRLDPCFAALDPAAAGAGCKNQLRLVFQSVTADTATGELHAFDSALHAFYSVDRAELVAMAQAVAELRVAQAGEQKLGALGPHPLMVAGEMTGAFARGVRALIQSHAGASNLIRVTTMSMNNAGLTWTFKGFDVSTATSVLTPMVIPSLPAGTTQESFFRGFSSDEMAGQFTPAPIGRDDFTLLTNVERMTAASASDQAAAEHALARVDNPSLNSPDTVDCAQCHLASPFVQLITTPQLAWQEAGDPDAFRADPVWVAPGDLKPTLTSGGAAMVNVHAFSYAGRDAGINQRTVNESAAVVAYLNQTQGK